MVGCCPRSNADVAASTLALPVKARRAHADLAAWNTDAISASMRASRLSVLALPGGPGKVAGLPRIDPGDLQAGLGAGREHGLFVTAGSFQNDANPGSGTQQFD